MAINKWQPDDLSDADRHLLERIPKATLYVIARQLAAWCNGTADNLEVGAEIIAIEWEAQYHAGHVPQKPTTQAMALALLGKARD